MTMFIALMGSAIINALHKMLVKSTPGRKSTEDIGRQKSFFKNGDFEKYQVRCGLAVGNLSWELIL